MGALIRLTLMLVITLLARSYKYRAACCPMPYNLTGSALSAGFSMRSRTGGEVSKPGPQTIRRRTWISPGRDHPKLTALGRQCRPIIDHRRTRLRGCCPWEAGMLR
ncbi:hypothetical protein C8Q77DRAFT_1116528 [Trametes polyzona]|nr:hypothetical protein C8Q77DRAFT_1116528 [Trametes polyzona]